MSPLMPTPFPFLSPVNTAPHGAFALVLHSHIPYVLSHGQWPHGTDWLTEVAAESYLPLLDVLHELLDEGITPRITLGLTPILCEQLADPAFKNEFTDWLLMQIGAASHDVRTFRASGDERLRLAEKWRDNFKQTLHRWETVYDRDIVGAFARLQNAGVVEIITSAATHGYLPLLGTDEAVNAQIQIGAQSYVQHFGRKPTGFWLPECAYRPRYKWNAPLAPFQKPEPVLRRGIDEFLSDAGISYTFVDGHLVDGTGAQGVYADRFGALKALWHQFSTQTAHTETGETSETRTPYRPCFVASSGTPAQTPVAVFSRDVRSSHAVWAADSGYPGDEWYLEFHKTHEPGRLRYWRVSHPKNDMAAKGLYDPQKAQERVQAHARHFAENMADLLKEQREAIGETGEMPIVTAMYDTELFGHWWHEGPQWLKAVLRHLAQNPDVQLTTCRAYLADAQTAAPDAKPEIVRLPEGSWGEGGFHSIWLNSKTEWMWEKIYEAEREMTDLADNYGHLESAARPLKQAARELLLLEASDWPFVTSTGGAPDYAEARIKAHFVNFEELARLVRAIGENDTEITENPSPWRVLDEVETRDNPFADVRPDYWKTK